MARSFEIRSGQDESPSRFYASCDPLIILLTRDTNSPYYSLFSNVIVWKKIKQILFPFKYNTNTNTTIKKWKGWENRKFLCTFNYYINTITIEKWKVFKVIFLKVYCKPKHDVKTLKKHIVSRSQVPGRPTWGSRYMAMWKELELGARSRLPALEGGKRGVLEVLGKTRKSWQALLTHTGLHEITQSG